MPIAGRPGFNPGRPSLDGSKARRLTANVNNDGSLDAANARAIHRATLQGRPATD